MTKPKGKPHQPRSRENTPLLTYFMRPHDSQQISGRLPHEVQASAEYTHCDV